ncbi:MAG TPA: hypothetical protein VMD09_14915 [Solirubrobacteraceae bacterium]|nr:hypothetical protein [Solirubrobacteraceae bacterium]
MPRNVGSAVYGLITVGALLAAESALHETYGETVAAVVLTLIAYWLAWGYADFTSARLSSGRPLTLAGFRHSMWQELPILFGAAVPLLAVALCWVTGASLNTGIDAGLWSTAGAIVIIEVVAGLRAQLSGRELAVQIAVGAVLGLLVLAAKLLLR